MRFIILDDKEDYQKRLGDTVRRLRLYHEMTMQELADKCGYSSRATINKIEKGLINVPQDKIAALASALKVAPVELLGDNNEAAQYTELFERLRRLPDQDREKAARMIDGILTTFEGDTV